MTGREISISSNKEDFVAFGGGGKEKGSNIMLILIR